MACCPRGGDFNRVSAFHDGKAKLLPLIYIEHGFRELYRGLVPILWRNGPSNAMFFVMREEADRRLPKRATAVTQRTQEFFAGACIGAFISSVFYPINVLKVTMQSKLGGPNESMWVALQQVYNERDRKLRNVYKGVSMNCTRAFFSWGIMNSAYEQLKKVFY
ncbi:mitochondrial carrier protein [Culex quinquefasciatus]|uniref:Mitochondrial carrier protein n=1 Tax=Culex quinquefasciatus TaxID=7176 RepID=B0X585_CULQU|nr:mitochondrial carrier protein [Culex quinquefasciatus]|eukprot:XP_001864807.1 mitochondrial carrier protein [Culex quinquefasciatus]